MCRSTAIARSRSSRTHRPSLSVDSFFFPNVQDTEITKETKENVAPSQKKYSQHGNNCDDKIKSSFDVGIHPKLLSLSSRPQQPLRQRAQTEWYHRSTSAKALGSAKRSAINTISTSISTCMRKVKKSVRFSKVETRGYNVIVYNHPAVTSGVGISFGWEHCPLSVVSVDDHQKKRTSVSARRNDDLLLSRKERNKKLLKYGNLTAREIWLAERKRELSDRAEFFRDPETFDMKTT